MSLPVSGFKMVPVEADSFTSVGYIPGARQLYVTFLRGETIVYDNVPGFRYEGLMAAPRKEAYFKTFIKNSFLAKPGTPPVPS